LGYGLVGLELLGGWLDLMMVFSSLNDAMIQQVRFVESPIWFETN